ncbi:efflux RND transporter periplasmic adaptor subunit [Micromonospora sp. NPDC051543]|uniref:efflux RND transporter periplasmic adaptor subunit n=1 Tax=Micromonospora sp. NPDC051543 TaxID=3364287 RepID=UPI0037B59C0B
MGEALTGRRRLIGAAVAVVVLALLGIGVARALTADSAAGPTGPATVAADRGEVSTEVATTGAIQPAQTRSLSFTVAGTVDSVAVRAGTTVTAGQKLATVDDTDADKAVTNARAALEDAQDALDEAESRADDPTDCGVDVVAAFAEPDAASSVARSSSASPSPTRSGSPTSSPSPTATVAPGRTTSVPRSTTGVPQTTTPAPRSGGSCAAGRPQQGQDGDAVLSARQRVTQATTVLRQAEDALSGTTITAPIAGRILTVAGKVGSQVSAGSAFITVADVYDMQIDADFPEADADRLATGQHAVVTLADRPGQQFAATVVQVDPTGTSDGTMVRYGALLAFAEAPTQLLVGQSAAVRVTTGAKADVLRVPSTAVHDVAGTTATVRKDGVALKVVIGLRGDQYTEVTSGLAEGDVVARSW